jgi:hypothetical protein
MPPAERDAILLAAAKRAEADYRNDPHLTETETFDQLLQPVRAQFAASGMSEAELDKIVGRARTQHHRKSLRKKS